MGLACYVCTPVALKTGESISNMEIWYGRKENEIHGWMQQKSGKTPEEFNCVDLDLTPEILDEFEFAMKSGGLVPTPGFFFGSPGTNEQVQEAAQKLLTAARTALVEGKQPYYTSWW